MTAGDPQFNRQQDQSNASIVSLGGGGMRANNYLLDGVPITELVGRAVLNPTIEAVEEVKVQVHTYDAEMGRTGGGVFNVTAKSGTNAFHGSGFYQTRPVWGVSENFFVEKEGKSKEESGLSDTYYRLYGGGIGGPIWKNRTFFWAASEGLSIQHDQERAAGLAEPEAARRRLLDLDASAASRSVFTTRIAVAESRTPSVRRQGRDRLPPAACSQAPSSRGPTPPRTPPASACSARGRRRASPGRSPPTRTTCPTPSPPGPIVDAADMFTIKAEHKFTDRSSLSGLYIYNKTDEPGSTIMKPDALVHRQSGQLLRPAAPAAARAGVQQHEHHQRHHGPHAALRLDDVAGRVRQAGLQPRDRIAGVQLELHQRPFAKGRLPGLRFDDATADVGGWGAIPNRWKSPYSINGTLSKLMGSHSFKVGGDMRRMGVATVSDTQMGGRFDFTRLSTSNNGVGGHELASVLLGAPYSGSVPFDDGPFEWFTKYYGAYVQDDWRVSERLTVNYGLRLEHEDGLREIENRQTVAFDQNVTSPLDARVPKTGLLAGRTIKGGLIFAGVDGAPEAQGNPAAVKVAPRAGVTYAPSKNTVVRGGYGLFYAPWNYTRAKHGQGGFTRTTALIQSDPTTAVPLVSLENPFPGGLIQPIGSSLGLLTGTGGTIEFVDQNKGDPKVHQYSVDVQRELPGAMASRSVTSAPPDATSATSVPAAATPAKRSTSTRSTRRSRARRFRGRTAPGTRRPCARRCPTRSSALPGAGEFADRARRFRRASSCVRSRSSATSTCSRKPMAGGGSITPPRSCSTSARPDGGAAASATP